MTQSPHRNSRYVVGVDVGTGGARAGLFDLSGTILCRQAEHFAVP